MPQTIWGALAAGVIGSVIAAAIILTILDIAVPRIPKKPRDSSDPFPPPSPSWREISRGGLGNDHRSSGG